MPSARPAAPGWLLGGAAAFGLVAGFALASRRRGAASVYARSPVPLGNGAFTADGRLVVSHHPMYGTPHRVSVFDADGDLSPFPDLSWNTPRADSDAWLDAVLGLHDDSQGRVWLMDMGTRSGVQPKMVVWDTRADALWKVIPLPPEVVNLHSEPNDFVYDEARGRIYIADEGAGNGGDGTTAALIVLDVETGAARRRLQGRAGVSSEPHPLRIAGQVVERHDAAGGPKPIRVGVDGIAMDDAGEWLYLSPLNGYTLWRLRVDDLLDPALDDDALAGLLERYADKPNSGGMWMDRDDNIYVTEIEASAVGRISARDRSYSRVATGRDMFWPDGLMPGPDGALYLVVTQLPRSPVLSGRGDRSHKPFKVFRLPLGRIGGRA